MSQYAPERLDARGVNLSSRIVASTTVVASPAAGSETIICSVTMPSDLRTFTGVVLLGWAAFTVGTSGISADLKIRQTGTSGTTIADSGAVTVAAGDLYSPAILGEDTAPAAGQIYKLTLTVGSGAAESTVSAVGLVAISV